MSKAVLISIKPKWCELIASGEKTIEIRKTKPKLETPFKCYIYQTNPKKRLIDVIKDGDEIFGETYHGKTQFIKTDNDGCHLAIHPIYKEYGKVIGEFICDGIISHCEMANADIAEQQGCIKREQLFEYANGKELYGWHISDLVIYDEPKMLHNFFKPCGDCDKKGTKRCTEELTYCRAKTITRPPQSWCYVEEVS